MQQLDDNAIVSVDTGLQHNWIIPPEYIRIKTLITFSSS